MIAFVCFSLPSSEPFVNFDNKQILKQHKNQNEYQQFISDSV